MIEAGVREFITYTYSEPASRIVEAVYLMIEIERRALWRGQQDPLDIPNIPLRTKEEK